ncbi:S8 family peptidase [Nocardioides solisilvae]|uniref:S8 family peptidase n=1 Tax=Nocardioides solisilvae TaxID=1542435 RepID=UPI001951EA1C|nr:S8 family peptidase [Nocardioides solisilvae]
MSARHTRLPLGVVALATGVGLALAPLGATAAPDPAAPGLPAPAAAPGLPAAPEVPAAGEDGLAPVLGEAADDRYIVVMDQGVSATKVENLSTKVRGQGAKVTHTFSRALDGFAGRLNAKALETLRADPRVAYIEPDLPVSISETQTPATWGIDRIDQRALPLNNSYTYGTSGSGVTAYVIDTGIRASHAELSGRVRSGYTAINDGRGTTDCNGHGTHVAGTIGGETYGVAQDVSLVAVRVLDCNGSGSNSGVIAGVDWVTSNHAAGAPAVANMSLGGGASTALDTAVRNSIADGVTYALAAGNDSGANACNGSPSRVTDALTVGSSTQTDARSSFSNIGSCLDLFAPGSSITSAWHTSDSATNTISGTSMAAPHVAGAAALYLQGNRSASSATVNNAIVSAATTGVVTNPGSGSPNRLLYVGTGGTQPHADPHADADAHADADGLQPAGAVHRLAERQRRLRPVPGHQRQLLLGRRDPRRLPRRAGRGRLRPLPAAVERLLVVHRGPGHHRRARRERHLLRHRGLLLLAGRLGLGERLLHLRARPPVTPAVVTAATPAVTTARPRRARRSPARLVACTSPGSA